jgi:hypothetical protein
MGYEVFSRCIPIENDILYRTRKNKKRNKGKPQKRGCPIGLKPLANGFIVSERIRQKGADTV